MNYKYKLFWRGIPKDDLGTLDAEFESSVPIDVGHHIEQVHCVAEVKTILHMQGTGEFFLVVEPIALAEEYGLR
jgi:hypothetical protein